MKADLSNILAGSGALLEKAEAALRNKLSSNQASELLIWQLAEVYRQKGQLDDALNYYHQLLGLNPAHQQARLLSAILSKVPVKDLLFTNQQPAIFVLLENILDAEEQKQIWDIIKKKNKHFSNAIIGDQENPSYRNSHILDQPELKAIYGWFMGKVEAHLAESWSRLPMVSFAPARRELQLTRHQDGEYYKLHTDNDNSESGNTRMLTFVYYFHQEPKKYSGGELQLFDSGSVQNSHTNSYTRLTPKHNSLIFFPSSTFHQVTPVINRSGELEHARFTLNGWLHKKD